MSELYPVFSVVGTTAVGKTSFAFQLAEALLANKKYSGVDIISADSRQIYKGLEILSGADIPEGFEREKDLSVSAFGFFQKGNVRLFGISIVQPDEDWSVAQFQVYARSIIDQSRMARRAIIIVGGTGLYHEQLFNLDATLQIPPNEEFRALAQDMTVLELQHLLQQLSPEKLEMMNNSDRNNSRRLVRAIEVAQSSEETPFVTAASEYEQKYIGLTASLDFIIKKINVRITKRMQGGVLVEVQQLQDTYGDRLCQHVQTTLGFEELSQLLSGTISKEEALQQWQIGEKQYAQRQLTWWKTKAFVQFFAIDERTDWWKLALKFASD